MTLWTRWVMGMNSPVDPWWYYEMGRMDGEHPHRSQRKPTAAEKTTLGIGLVMFWGVMTAVLSVMVYTIGLFCGGWDFWFCLMVGGIIAFWFCLIATR